MVRDVEIAKILLLVLIEVTFRLVIYAVVQEETVKNFCYVAFELSAFVSAVDWHCRSVSKFAQNYNPKGLFFLVILCVKPSYYYSR